MPLPNLLLHVCCAPCSPHIVVTLLKTHKLTLYFYNPNIHPREEYDQRLSEISSWAKYMEIPLVADDYEIKKWFAAIKGLESEPERGKRCAVCFDVRLQATAKTARRLGISKFGTVLSVSPYKESALINCIGKDAGEKEGVIFYEADWKKKDGYKITTKMAQQAGFYRQHYCGCVFSQRQ
ncbi:MAG TPA: epoxyqueuosine reductase QueH [Nitrospinota bacterium]|nr:epoxyqueuosine reductase QueH [Nitrospinota bacterium]